MDPRQIRRANDYKDLVALKYQSNGMFDFSVDRTRQHYDITIDGIETLVGTTESNYNRCSRHVFHIELLPGYPVTAPIVTFDNPIFHPNWYDTGELCYGSQWAASDRLRDFIVDIIQMLMFEIVRPSSSANLHAKEWYLRNESHVRDMISRVQFPPPAEDGLIIYEDDDDELELL